MSRCLPHWVVTGLLGDIPLVELVEGVEGHVRRALHLAQEVHLPGHRSLLGLEAVLGLLRASPVQSR